ncbi:MAG TPA: hypothetical protein VIJ75_00620 [Hanamia sp.]
MDRREFARLTSLAALSLPYKNTFGSLISVDQFKNKDDIKKKSIAAFKRFETVWNFNDFWKRGNTFDACLTFADAMHVVLFVILPYLSVDTRGKYSG